MKFSFMNKKIQNITVVILTGFFFILDKILKNFFLKNPEFEKTIFSNFFSFSFFKNHGIAFGIQSPFKLTIGLSIIILIILLFWFYKNKKYYNASYFLAFSLIFFGALSNLSDRLFLNFTVDYIHIYISVINLADVMIVLGASIILIKEIFIRKKIETIV